MGTAKHDWHTSGELDLKNRAEGLGVNRAPSIHPFALTAVLVVAAICFTYHVYNFFNSLDDDAFIPIRYSLNFLRGLGWVMNSGEHVEGTTSPLHVWFLTGLLRFCSIDQAIWFEKAVGYFLGLGVLGVTFHLGTTLWGRTSYIPHIGVVLCALRPEFALSMTNGLETGGAIFLLLLGVHEFVANRRTSAAVILIAAALARPELVLAFPILFVTVSKPDKDARKAMALYAISIALCLFARWMYYGDVVPNTYYAKKMPLGEALPQGAEYLAAHLSYGPYPLSLWLLALPITTLLAFPRCRAPLGSVLVLIALFGLLSSGSWMPDGRLCAPAIPVICLLWGGCLVKLLNFARQPQLQLAVGTLAAWFLFSDTDAREQSLSNLFGMAPLSASAPQIPMGRWRCAVPGGRRLIGNWIQEHVPRGELVACSEMGVPTVMNMDIQFLDVRGLSDRRIANMQADVHHSNVGVYLNGWTDFDNELLTYVLSRRPYAIVAFDGGDGAPHLLREYHPGGDFVLEENGWRVRTWIRN